MKKLFLTVFFALIIISPANAQSILALQEKCANAAREYYEREVNKDCRPNYKSHYNKKLDKCFILVTTQCSGKYDYSTSIVLTDVFEREVYSYFILDRNCSGNKAWVDCGGLGMGKLCDDDKKCKTWREVENLIRPYMEK
jgi:hypothetical protein